MGRVIEGMVFPDGWHYVQTWNGKQFRIDSDSYQNLLVAVETWRVQNTADVNNVKGDVDNQLCGKHPHHCHGESVPVLGEAPVNKAQTFIDRLIQWGRRMINSPLTKTQVSTDEATRRANICLRCPRHIRWENSCGTCVGAAEQLFTLARGMKDVPGLGQKLKACSSFNFNCRTAVWLTREALADQAGNDPFQDCWNK